MNAIDQCNMHLANADSCAQQVELILADAVTAGLLKLIGAHRYEMIGEAGAACAAWNQAHEMRKRPRLAVKRPEVFR